MAAHSASKAARRWEIENFWYYCLTDQCDENRPQCGRCDKANQHCSLSEMSSNLMFISITPTTERNKKSASTVESRPGSDLTPSSMISRGPSTDTSPADISTSPSFTSTSESNVADSHLSDTERERLRLMHHYIWCFTVCWVWARSIWHWAVSPKHDIQY